MFFILTLGNLLVNKADLQVIYLSGTYCTRPIQDPLFVIRLEKRLYMLYRTILEGKALFWIVGLVLLEGLIDLLMDKFTQIMWNKLSLKTFTIIYSLNSSVMIEEGSTKHQSPWKEVYKISYYKLCSIFKVVIWEPNSKPSLLAVFVAHWIHQHSRKDLEKYRNCPKNQV